MAEEIDDGEFWLPSQFLTEEDILTDFDISTPTTNSSNGFSSDLGSPVESVTGTESDEDEFIAGLTRQMARSSLHHDYGTANPKGWVSSGSPQSMLYPIGGVRGGSGDGLSRGSPTSPVSPPPASAKGGAAAFHLLHAAAGEVAKMKMRSKQEGSGSFDSSRGLLCAPRKQNSSVSPSLKVDTNNNPNFAGVFSHQSRQSHEQLQAFQLWSQEMTKQQSKAGMWSVVNPSEQTISRSNNGEEFLPGGISNRHHHNRPLGLSPSAWPPLQRPGNQQLHPPGSAQNLSGSGMRAFFLGAPGSKGESVGTGVFLPRRVNPTEPRKSSNKAACSTVLVPAKVVRALSNINAQSQSKHSTGRFRGHNNGVQAQRRNSDNARSQSVASLEIQLPSEWTY